MHTPPTYIRNWERDLEQTLEESELMKIFALMHSLNRSVASQECNYKILARWYRCLPSVRAVFPSATDQCWRYDHMSSSKTLRTPEVALLLAPWLTFKYKERSAPLLSVGS